MSLLQTTSTEEANAVALAFVMHYSSCFHRNGYLGSMRLSFNHHFLFFDWRFFVLGVRAQSWCYETNFLELPKVQAFMASKVRKLQACPASGRRAAVQVKLVRNPV